MKSKILLTFLVLTVSISTAKSIPFDDIEFSKGEKTFVNGFINQELGTSVISGQPTSLEFDCIVRVTIGPGASYQFIQLQNKFPLKTGTAFGDANLDTADANSTAILNTPESSSSMVFVGLGLGLLLYGSMTNRTRFSNSAE